MPGPLHLLEVAVEPKSRSERELLEALSALTRFDPHLRATTDTESGQTILAGDSEEHLESAVALLCELFEIELDVGAPQIAYREALRERVVIRYTHRRANGGPGQGAVPQYADVRIAFEPLPPNSGFVFENSSPDGAIPIEFIPAVEKGLRVQASSGLLAGFPVIDFKAELVGGSYHEVDSNSLTFDIAARAAFRELAAKKVAILLEPLMRVAVLTPDDFLVGVIGDLNSRRGRLLGTDGAGSFQVVEAIVPLASMFGYANTLAAMTQRRAHYIMAFERYEPVPEHIIDGGDDDNFPPAIGMRA